MNGSGLFNDQFNLGIGDVFEVSGDEGDDETRPPPPKSKPCAFPTIEGEETTAEFVAKYKRALLNRRQVFRENHERWESEKPATGRRLVHPIKKKSLKYGNKLFWGAGL